MSNKPQVLLDHYLKQLRLPTILREYRKVAEQCAREDVDCQRFLLRLVELEVVEREQRSTERRIKAAKFPVLKSLETFDFLAIPSLNKQLVLELARERIHQPEGERPGLGQLRHRQDPRWTRARTGSMPARLSSALHHRRRTGP